MNELYLHEAHVAGVVGAPVHSERLLLHHAAVDGLQVNVVAVLQTHTNTRVHDCACTFMYTAACKYTAAVCSMQ